MFIYAPSLVLNQGINFQTFQFGQPSCLFLCIIHKPSSPNRELFSVSGYNTHVVAIFVSSICIFYTTFGGLKAVIWADTLQLTVTLLSFSIALIIGIVSAGGLGNVWKKAEAGDRLHFFELVALILNKVHQFSS